MCKVLVPTGECIDTGEGFNPDGFPVFDLGTGISFASRVGYALHYGYDPGAWEVGMTCGDKSCVNPRHMVLTDCEGVEIKQPEYAPGYPRVRRPQDTGKPYPLVE